MPFGCFDRFLYLRCDILEWWKALLAVCVSLRLWANLWAGSLFRLTYETGLCISLRLQGASTLLVECTSVTHISLCCLAPPWNLSLLSGVLTWFRFYTLLVSICLAWEWEKQVGWKSLVITFYASLVFLLLIFLLYLSVIRRLISVMHNMWFIIVLRALVHARKLVRLCNLTTPLVVSVIRFDLCT